MLDFGVGPEDPLRAKFDNLATLVDFAAGRRDAPAFPVRLFLEAANVCNLKCLMCCEFSPANPDRIIAFKAIERGMFDYRRHAEALAPLLRAALVVHCFGFGEPTLNPDFLALLANCAEQGCMVDFFTNGTCLTPEFCDALVARRVWQVTVSLSGVTRETYETVYRGGRFAALIDGLRRLHAAKARVGATFPRVVVNSLAFTHHVERFDSFCALMAGCGVDSILLRPVQIYGADVPTPIPLVHRLAAIYRPWVDDPILERARRITESFGILLEDHLYRADGVADEAAYQARLAEREAYLAGCPPEQAGVRHLGEVDAALSHMRYHPTERRKEQVCASALPPDPLPAQLRGVLELRPMPWPDQTQPFFCLEPFTTLYVRQDGRVKPCCFGVNAAPNLGNLALADGAAIWNGPGFRAIRSGIGHDVYSRQICGTCLAGGVGPRRWDTFLAEYLDWLGRPEIADALAGTVARLRALSNGDLIDGHFRNRAEPFLFGDEAEVLAGLGPRDFEGHLDLIRDNTLFGWLWSPKAPQLRYEVEAVVGTRVIGRGRPEPETRADLVAAGKGDGRYGFALALGARPGDGEEIQLRLAARPDLVVLRRAGAGLMSAP
ncbi:radical SAM/SPASM domain-containing protein [Phaeospirillum tilakii]|uniref:Radical SAM/SPASM domain-containing protein n=1 Tax=Phaeospirillum tilakii TaxID=741673 RepID=A0ABW5CBL0_9PROT